MSTTKKSAKKSTRKGTKKAASKKAGRKRSGKATPPPDDPLLRHEENSIDRRIFDFAEQSANRSSARKGSRKGSTAAATLAAGAEAAEQREVEITTMAHLRLNALLQSRGMPQGDAGAPALATPGAHEPDTVAPVSGVSNWVQLGPTAIPNGQTYGGVRVLVTGRVTSIVIDPGNPNIIYCGTAQGGVWKTTDGGKSWVAKSDNEVSLAIGALAMDPSNSQILYAGTGEGNFSTDSYYGNGILKTTNGGASWTALATATFTGTRFSRIAVTPGTPLRLFAATGNGIYRSTDGGVNWTQMTNGLPAIAGIVRAATDVVIDPATPTTVYAAFWGGGIYKTTNASAANPTWTQLAGGLPSAATPSPNGFTRVRLGLSPTAPQTLYALFANNDTTPGSPTQYAINKFYVTTNGGTNWTQIALPGGSIGKQGFYNINVTVDPTSPDIVYLSAISLWKATRNAMTNVWTITEVGSKIHPDNHALAIQTTNHLVVYAGNDGGIYKSIDGGANWDDTINEGLCITQFEFIDQHPTSDAVVFGGTQDNGTEEFRNSPVFYHADDGDGGYCVVDKTQPKNVVSTYYGNTPKRSTLAGKFGTWMSVSAGIAGPGLFYPPMAMDETNSNNLAFGTDRINLDAAQGTGGWPTKVTLPGITDRVSAIHYTNSTLIYAGTNTGQVYRLKKSGGAWTATAIHAAPLPVGAFITDLAAVPGSPDTVVVLMSGFGIGHVWRGVVPAAGVAAWTNVSGGGGGAIPDIPANALVIEPAAPTTYYVATDVAVYRTTNGGTSWIQFSQGLPNCAVFDMRLHNPTRLLRAATHGRGLWERRLDVPSVPDVDLYFRDHLMSTGRVVPCPEPVAAAFEDPLQYVNLGDPLYHWMCADIKVDALEGTPPAFQMPVASVDYAAYETKLQHRNAQRGNVNRAYVKVNNRGFAAGANVTVKLLYADASAGLPPLPADFWTAFPNNSADTTKWQPIGNAKVIPSLSPTEPTILEWDFSLPNTAATHSCLLAIMDSPANPIPAGNKIFNVDTLVRNEKRVGLKNLHVVDIPAGASMWTTLDLNAVEGGKSSAIRVIGSGAGGGSVGFLLPKSIRFAGVAEAVVRGARKGARKGAQGALANLRTRLDGFVARRASAQLVKSLKDALPVEAARLDLTRLYVLDKEARGGGRIAEFNIPKGGLRAAVLLTAPAQGGDFSTFTVVQEQDGDTVGGSTYVVRPQKK
jgi:photosystem II stability/assembly factor-like uncharacterized protein